MGIRGGEGLPFYTADGIAQNLSVRDAQHSAVVGIIETSPTSPVISG